MKNIAWCFLLFAAHISANEGNFNEKECQKLLFSSKEVSYPKVVMKLDRVTFSKSAFGGKKETAAYEGIKYPENKDLYTRVTFAKTKAYSQNKLIINLSKYWGVWSSDVPSSYWDSIVYFIEGLGRFPVLGCQSLDVSNKIDVIVSSVMSPEVFHHKSHDTIVLVYDFDDGYYYLVSKSSDGQYSVELKMNINNEVYTIVVFGPDREKLEFFVTSVIDLNVKK